MVWIYLLRLLISFVVLLVVNPKLFRSVAVADRLDF